MRFWFSIIALYFCICLLGCFNDSLDSDLTYLPLDDSEYPYVGLPRLVIETKNFQQILDKETYIPAQLQVYGEKSPSSEILPLSVRGRGYSSFQYMAKPGMKLKFDEKQPLLGMPKDKEWALIANYADRTHLRNYISYKLAGWLGDDYTPRARFVEVYLNRQYRGVFLLVETAKASKNRVNIAKNDRSFLLEKDATKKEGDVVIKTKEGGFRFKICYPKNPSEESQKLIKKHLDDFESYLKRYVYFDKDSISNWMDLEDYIRFYWVQEFAKNYDGAFRRSIFLTWEEGGVVRWGPVWDFDAGYGNWEVSDMPLVSQWYVRDSGWNRWMFRNEKLKLRAKDYWLEHRQVFESVLDSIDLYAEDIKHYVKNDFKRWPTLQMSGEFPFRESYDSYESAVDTLKSWIRRRIEWIDDNL